MTASIINVQTKKHYLHITMSCMIENKRKMVGGITRGPQDNSRENPQKNSQENPEKIL